MKKAVEVVRALRARYYLPIGVSVYPTKTSSEDLYSAGATDVKYNVETIDPEIFRRCCPGLSQDLIIKSLERAVDIFGRNNVTSNFIIGIGESDDCVSEGVTRLADSGVIPILRPISPHPLRSREIEVQRPSADRLLRLGRMLRSILDERGLEADRARTMCLPCTGCDMTPHRDI